MSDPDIPYGYYDFSDDVCGEPEPSAQGRHGADIHEVLQRYWGFPGFRPCQEEIIRSVLSGRDTIGLLPTGGGKSITFQVPALVLPGLTVVVTPLISLMKDQIDNLSDRGIRAVCLHSGMSRAESEYACELCHSGKIKILYVAPERLGRGTFISRLRTWNLSLLVVDEAHCISQWGYDFRPSYLKINTVRDIFPHVPVLALTASATPGVVADISARLSLTSPALFSLSFSRDNISYLVRRCDKKEDTMMRVLRNTVGSAIVYVRSRKRTRELCSYIRAEGITSEYYHAGLTAEEKEDFQNRWRSGESRVMVATTAFGMGIDKPDVRVVIHHDIPSTLEEYYQEAGRAGRDGLRSFAVLLYTDGDKAALSRRITENFPPKDFLLKVYDCTCVFLNVGVGAGYNRTFEFNPEVMASRFGLPLPQTRSALSILSRTGYIEYVDEVATRSRLMILSSREDIYYLSLDSSTEAVLQAIMRCYGGLFADYVYISERLVAYRLGIKPDDVYQALLKLSRMRVVSYIPLSRTPYIYYPTSRELSKHLVIPREVYEERRKCFENRIKAMKEYIWGEEGCRVNRMLRYFGETAEKPCGSCDICRATRKRHAADSAGIKQRLMSVLMEYARGNEPVDIDSVLAHFAACTAEAVDILRNLAESGEIELTASTVRLIRANGK